MTLENLENILSKMLRISLLAASAVKLPGFYVLLRRAFWRARLCELGNNCLIYPRVVIHSPGSVVIGDQVSIAEFVHIWGEGRVYIGNKVMIASHCRITSQTHDVNVATRHSNIIKPVKICDNVWIGSGAMILPGVSIGENSVIAAGSIVTSDIPSNSLAMGSPARVTRSINQQ